MKTVVALAFVLAGVFVATESESPPDIPFPYENCYNRLRECTAPLSQNPLLVAVARDNNQLIEHIDDVCEILEPVERCLRPDIDSCHEDLQNQLRSVISVGDFLCSDEGKSLLRQFKTSECYDNPIKSYELQGFTELCVAEAAANQPSGAEEDKCQLVADVSDCIVRETKNLCGDAAGRLVDGIASNIISIYTNSVCTVKETRGWVLDRKRFFDDKKDLERDPYWKRFFDDKKDLERNLDRKRFPEDKKDLERDPYWKRFFLEDKKDLERDLDWKRFFDDKKDLARDPYWKRFFYDKKDLERDLDWKRFPEDKKDLERDPYWKRFFDDKKDL